MAIITNINKVINEVTDIYGLPLIKNLVKKEKHNLKCPYPLTDIEYIVIHNTANNQSARNEINYMIGNNDERSFHFAVDDIEIVQGVSLEYNTWHAGDGRRGKGNRNGISVEICYSTGDNAKFLKAEENAAKLTAFLLDIFDMQILQVQPHKVFSGKYCPHKTLDLGWDRFINMVNKHRKKKQKEVEKVAEIKTTHKPSNWAITSQKFVMDNNISDGSYPQKMTSREEIWTMLERFYNLINKTR